MQPERRVCLLTGAGGRLGSDFCRRYRSQYNIVAVYPQEATSRRLPGHLARRPAQPARGPSGPTVTASSPYARTWLTTTI